MRQAGTDYPEWVTERYLGVPDTITPRTGALAQAIVGDLETPYDKAAAVTSFLRSQIEYSETIPELPQDQELLDWFLFDLQQGFCNYYASAEVILLRILGVPARLAIGYASGEPEEVTDVYVVRQRDAHAWVEVYFPGLGWVEFEPTAGQPELLRPPGEAINAPPIVPMQETLAELQDRLNRDLQLEPPSQTADAAANRAVFWRIAVSAALVLVLGLILFPMGWKRQLLEKLPPIPIILEKGIRRAGFQPPQFLRRWAQRAALSPLARSYLEINRALNRLGRPASLADTPAERASTLALELPAAQPPAQRLLGEYETATYGQQSPNLEAAKQAGAEIRSLSFRTFFQRLLRGKPDPSEESFRKHRW
jgi:hypothetical protein